jgi:hypothetical protein
MDELDLFRDFRQGAGLPSREAERQARARLERAVTRGRTGARPIPGYRMAAIAVAVVAVVAVATLSVSTPWHGSPSFLERAAAALTAPPGTVLHEKWNLTVISTTPQRCTVDRGTQEIWIDQKPPHRFRALLNDISPESGLYPNQPVCGPAGPMEIGGWLPRPDAYGWLLFVPPDELRIVQPLYAIDPDPVTRLRRWIRMGYAVDEGKVRLDGRAVERIRMDPPPDCVDPNAECPPAYAYVDPDTFFLVRLENPTAVIDYDKPSSVGWRFDTVVQMRTFEYLPRTRVSLALTDIRARHPNATLRRSP